MPLEGMVTGIGDPLHAIYGPAALSQPITGDELEVWLSAGHRG
jgi:hypothetical protein